MVIVARITTKGQTTIPHEIRAALQIGPGGLIAWELVDDGSARVRRVQPLGLECLRALEGTLPECGSAATRKPAVTSEPAALPASDFDAFTVERVPFPFAGHGGR